MQRGHKRQVRTALRAFIEQEGGIQTKKKLKLRSACSEQILARK